MFTDPPCCPNPDCDFHAAPGPSWFAKKGYYRTKLDPQPVPRYRCKNCGSRFGAHTFSPTYRQHKPTVNAAIVNLLCSGVTMRRTSRILGVCRRTLAKKLKWLGSHARAAHADYLQKEEMETAYVQFDEMETYEWSKLLPLSIALAVRAKTGDIIGVKVARMNCHGKTAHASVSKYGRRTDTRLAAAQEVMREIKVVSSPDLTIATDKKAAYRNIIKKELPHATHAVHKSRKTQALPQAQSKGQPHDPLFTLNHICAKLRADLTRLHRRTWAASKKAHCLQDAIDLYVAYHNGYFMG